MMGSYVFPSSVILYSERGGNSGNKITVITGSPRNNRNTFAMVDEAV